MASSIELKAQLLKMLPPAPPAQAPAQVAPAAKQEPKVVDWKLECAHHAERPDAESADPSKRNPDEQPRPLVQQTPLEVVPKKGKSSEKVTLHWRNDLTPPPPSIKVDGKAVQKGSAQGKYQTYAFDAEFTGDGEERRFYHPQFWVKYRQTTVHRVEDGPGAISVVVHNPRRYHLDIKFPPLKAKKTGRKWSRDPVVDEAGKRSFAKLQPTDKEVTKERSGWANSRLENRWSQETEVFSPNPEKAGKKPPDWKRTPAVQSPVTFKVDDFAVKLEIVDTVGQLLAFAESIQKIVKAFKDNAPQVGWYVDVDIQFLQGAFVLEWNWKEHTDGTAYPYADVYVAATLASITLETGAGLSGLGFKAQVFVSFSGAVDMKLGARTVSPEAQAIRVPITGTITGTAGARVEAGNLAKVEATLSTALELEFLVKFGMRRTGANDEMFSWDKTVKWTGWEAVIVASVGFFGIGGTWTGKRTLAEERTLYRGRWPSKEPYRLPHVSRDRIRQVVLTALTDADLKIIVAYGAHGWSRNTYLELDKAADALTDKIDAFPDLDRSETNVEGIAAGIRGDLEDKAALEKDGYVPKGVFDLYLTDPQAGLPKRLEQARSMVADLVSPAGK